ncbi:serine hydrolase domain-containing protein [Flavobacterium ardleyense]|uniref:Serine hydrolase domain-containing protein n=1 Tax=Flavobacterium ardleyense TaxID=2038737 RepID=A0ABW5Z3Z7_9FLAO
MSKYISILFFLLFSIYSFSQNQLKIIDNNIKAKLKKFPSVGIVIGIYKDSKTYYFTYENQLVSTKAKMDSTTIFEIGSATKTFTALLLAQEIAKGNIKQFDFVDKYLNKKLKLNYNIKNKIFITDLATHQSGLPNLSTDKYFSDLMEKDSRNPFRFVDEKYLFDVLKTTDSLNNFRQYQYNNFAFSLLGNIIEHNSKLKFEDLIKTQILIPLQMNSTSFERFENKNNAALHNQQGIIQIPMILNKANAAGGLKSNAVDLIKYLKAHLNNNLAIIPASIIERTYYEDTNKKMGLGWEIEDDFFQKDGDTFGNSSLIRYSHKNNVGIVILSNHQNGQLVRDLMTEVYDVIKK